MNIENKFYLNIDYYFVKEIQLMVGQCLEVGNALA